MTSPNHARTSDAPLSSHHQPFTMLPDSLRRDSDAEFAATTYDAIRGIKLCVELIHSSDLERQHNFFADTASDHGLPTLSVAQADTLIRFVIVASDMLATAAESHIGRMEKHSQQGGAQ